MIKEFNILKTFKNATHFKIPGKINDSFHAVIKAQLDFVAINIFCGNYVWYLY